MKRDVRNFGSGNPGATNMLRQFGFKVGIITFALDMIKGSAAALVGFSSFGFYGNGAMIALYACGLAAALGHCFPVIYKFRGGKGVATVVGVFLVASPIMSLIAMAVAFAYILIWEYGAMASFMFITILAIYQVGILEQENLTVSILLVCFYFLIWVTHRKNIFRLLTGEESRASILRKIKRRILDKKQQAWQESDQPIPS